MTTAKEAEKDLSLDADAAERVSGGAGKRRKMRQVTRKGPWYLATVVPPTPQGLDMGPDPAYPNPDGGDTD